MTLPFPTEHRYYSFNHYLKTKFGEKVYRISLDGGFTCPTRDGSLGTRGCIYCDNASFANDRKTSLPTIQEQMGQGVTRLKKRGVNKFLAYFQAYTNTYGEVAELMQMYQSVLEFPGVVGIAIGTRPDCLPEKLLDELAELNRKTYISVEIGIESVYDETLKWAQRGHTFADTESAVRMLKERNIHTAGHHILGFPTESHEQMLNAAGILNGLQLDALKLHHLHIVKNTKLATVYNDEPFHLFTENEWILLMTEFLEHLESDIVFQRLVGDAKGETLIAPHWQMSKSEILQAIRKNLAERDSYQGKLANR